MVLKIHKYKFKKNLTIINKIRRWDDKRKKAKQKAKKLIDAVFKSRKD